MTSAQTNGQDAKEEVYGTQLSAARLRRGLTVQQVAGQLNLPVERIDEIESGQFNSTISATFYRGYIRSYAQLMKLSDTEVLAGFDGAFSDDVALRGLGSIGAVNAATRREVNTRSSVFKWVTGLIVVGILVAAIWGIKEQFIDQKNGVPAGEISAELFSDVNESSPGETTLAADNPSLTGTTNEGESTSAISEDKVVEPTSLDTSNVSTPIKNNAPIAATDSSLSNKANEATTSQASKPLDENALTSGPASTESSSAPAELTRLSFVFTSDCWVEVSDARGERLAIGLKKSGHVMNLEGIAPFSILLGDGSAVQLKRDGETVDLNRYRSGQTARLTL